MNDTSRVCAVAFLLVFPSITLAQAPPAAPPPPPPRWERKAELSFVSTGGNTDTQSLGLGASVVFRPPKWTTEARTAFVRNETDSMETAKSWIFDFREARALSERAEVFGRYGYLTDRFAGIEHRNTIDGGVGYKLLLGPVHTLRVDGGLGYTSEGRVTGESQSFALVNIGSAYKWQFSKTADLTDSAVLTESLENHDEWRFTNAIALSAALTRIFSLKLSNDLKFNNSPVPGFEKTDRVTSAAIVAKF
jgi:putative salt-induced outer membrane protein